MTDMIVDEIEEKSGFFGKEITARVANGRRQTPVWFRWTGESCPVPGDVFLCAVLQPAMRNGGKLVFKGSVSRGLAELLPRIQEAFVEEGDSLRPVEVDIETVSKADRPKSRDTASVQGSLFNRDINAFYTLLKKQEKVQNLLVVHGHHSGSYMQRFRSRALIKYHASVLKKTVVEVETNSNVLYGNSEGTINPDYPMLLAAVGLIHSGTFSRLYLPAHNGFESGKTDRLTEVINTLLKENGTTLIHHGSDVDEAEKIDTIASNDLFIEALRMCWENPTRNYNCGRCRRCTRNDEPQQIVKRLGIEDGIVGPPQDHIHPSAAAE
ncbi:MAG: hypothetical protein GY866_12645 [Proteobacteria bacterium]|nr:hypothetical protein [Pseudomonadota bacterium]